MGQINLVNLRCALLEVTQQFIGKLGGDIRLTLGNRPYRKDQFRSADTFQNIPARAGLQCQIGVIFGF
ncbi:hypothetical protein D3C71_2175800 [compost metagenome]